jgi:hypothetical protein
MIDESWLLAALSSGVVQADDGGAVHRLHALLEGWADGFAKKRTDVASSRLALPGRGLLPDEAASFLRALDEGLVAVDDAGFFKLPTVRPKVPLGRYSLLSKNGSGVSLNLEYLIQVGATSELMLDHGWPPEAVDFERGEFDALGLGSDGRVCLAMEAKARVSGSDSLEGLLRFWLRALAEPGIDLRNNSGRKLAELRRRCLDGPVLVWLVAEGVRWSLWAEMQGNEVVLSPGPSPTSPTAMDLLARKKEPAMHKAYPYDATYHRNGSVAAMGRCSQHGLDSCKEPPVISFQDRHNRWQSGCARAVQELTARGEIVTPGDPGQGDR